MSRFVVFLSTISILMLAACNNKGSKPVYSECGSPAARNAIDNLFKDELAYGVQAKLDSLKALDSYDATELDSAVKRLNVTLTDVRTSRDDPNSSRFSCRATLNLDIPKIVEQEANITRGMAELGDIRKLANRYKMKRKGQNYTIDFDYFIQPTDDGKKLFAEMDDNSPAMKFAGEILASYLLSDEIREEKIAKDQAEAAALQAKRDKERAEEERAREIDEAYDAEAAADLNAAKVERDLASDRIQATWNDMPKDVQDQIGKMHTAWKQKMNAQCKREAAGSDPRKAVREAKELRCQTRMVRSCTRTLERNLSKFNTTTSWYCPLS